MRSLLLLFARRGCWPSCVIAIALCWPVAAVAEVKLPAIFSDHMVLTRSAEVPVWGWATPSEPVSVRLGEAHADTVTDATGHWRLKLNLSHAGRGSLAMTVKGTNELVVNDVLVGVVWLSSGQSNMEFPLRGSIGSQEAIAQSKNDQIRFFRLAKVGKPSPAEDCKGSWIAADPSTSGAFSAIAYYFAKRLQSSLGVPVGVIDNSWGGTISELWLSREAMDSVKELRDGEAARVQLMDDNDTKKAAFVHDFGQWLASTHREDAASVDIAPYLADSPNSIQWKTVHLPGPVTDAPGVYWIRKEINITHEQAYSNLDFKVMIGPLEGFERAYWNGQKIAETPYSRYPGTGYPRYYPIPRDLLVDGRNVITLRIYAPGTPSQLMAVPNNFWAGPLMLAGDWQVATERTLPPLNATELAQMPRSPGQVAHGRASALFNGVLAPLVPYSIDGVIWYQGESDADRAFQYRVTFPLLIQDWRSKWGRSDLPFIFCQLPRWGVKQTLPGESQWAEVREGQMEALKLPNTGAAVLIDQGEGNDLHPRMKSVVGERLAQIALANVYKRLPPQGSPTFSTVTLKDGRADVRFVNVHGQLAAKPLSATYDIKTLLGETGPQLPDVPGSELQGFAICGADHHWVWANAKVAGKDKVTVWSDQVPDPVAVRFGWADDPTVNLYDSLGLPAAPFRTDSFPALTAGKLYGPGT